MLQETLQETNAEVLLTSTGKMQVILGLVEHCPKLHTIIYTDQEVGSPTPEPTWLANVDAVRAKLTKFGRTLVVNKYSDLLTDAQVQWVSAFVRGVRTFKEETSLPFLSCCSLIPHHLLASSHMVDGLRYPHAANPAQSAINRTFTRSTT